MLDDRYRWGAGSRLGVLASRQVHPVEGVRRTGKHRGSLGAVVCVMKPALRHELLWELIARWYGIESEIAQSPLTFPPLHAAPFDLIITIAAKQVIAVICGQLTWDQATQGDRAIWTMRTRMTPDRVELDLDKTVKDIKAMTPAEQRQLRLKQEMEAY